MLVNVFFFVQEKKEILGASPAGRVPDPRKSNLHEIIYIKLGMALNVVDQSGPYPFLDIFFP